MLKARKKLTKQELKHDPLLDTLEKGKDFFEANKQQIYIAVGAVLLVLLGGWAWMNNVETTNNKAMLANTKANLAATQGMNDDVLSQLEAVVAEYGSNKNVSQTILKLGMAKLSEADYSGARAEFQKLATSRDAQTQVAGKLKLAYLSELEQDYTTAAKYYTEISIKEKGLVAKYAKLQSGYAYLAADDVARAKIIADELMADDPTGNFKENVEYLQGQVLEK